MEEGRKGRRGGDEDEGGEEKVGKKRKGCGNKRQKKINHTKHPKKTYMYTQTPETRKDTRTKNTEHKGRIINTDRDKRKELVKSKRDPRLHYSSHVIFSTKHAPTAIFSLLFFCAAVGKQQR